MLAGNVLPCMEVYRQFRAYGEGRRLNGAAVWRAESFRSTCGEAMTVRRAKALNAVLDRCDLEVWPGELLIGTGWYGRMLAEGAYPDEAVTEASDELARVGRRTFRTHADHHAPDYPGLLALGFGGLRERVASSLARHTEPRRRTFLTSVAVALDGASRHMRRWAARLAELADEHPGHAELLRQQAQMMDRLAEHAPTTFWEALQLVFSVHAMMQMDERYAMAFGRLDQYLHPFYRADCDAGRLTRDEAQVLLEHFFAKVTGYEDVQNITVGGVRPKDGEDATNDLSFLVLEACARVGRPGGNVTARIHAKTPAAFLRKCAEVIRSGVGYPAVFNDGVEVPTLVEQGYGLEEARDYGFVGCIEVFIPGRMAPWADSRFNLLRCVNLTLHGGVDNLTGEAVGPALRPAQGGLSLSKPATGEPENWDAFYDAFRTQMRALLQEHIKALSEAKQAVEDRADEFTSPLMSALTADCIERGRDLNDGGARHPANHGIAGMGIGTTADALMAVKRLVYDEKRFDLSQLRRMLAANFEGYEAERQVLLRRAPKFGNNDAEVDAIAVRVTRDFGSECLEHRTPQGGRYWGLMAANVQNIPAGREVGATADGRFSQQPLSDAASPTFGRDTNGPTAVIHSVAKLPYRLCPGGNVVNIKLHPSVLRGERGLTALAALIRTAFDLGAVELQFNTVDRKLLLAAMERPEEYRDLVVRVSGFSAHFVSLDRAVQEDVLARTEHGQP
jgi:formate C-acetyltransferase